MQDTRKPTLFGREPVLYLALAQAALALVAGFGFDLTAQQIGLVMAFVAAVLGVLARSQVTPVETLPPAETVVTVHTTDPAASVEAAPGASREAIVTDAINRLSRASGGRG